MNILVLATGGTIGSAAENGVIAPNADSELRLLQTYRTQYAGKAHFEIQKICSILSENADDRFYETLITALQDVDPNAYAGVIVLHGTDTLSYTAALCAMACRNFPLPVCFVSSAYVLSDARQNGVANFHAAVRYIESGLSGFVVPYRNRNGETQIHLATRILEADPFLADFHSAMEQPLAVFRDGRVEPLSSPALPTQTQLREMRSLPVKRVSFPKSVFPLKLFPNPALDAISPTPRPAARYCCSAITRVQRPRQSSPASHGVWRKRKSLCICRPLPRPTHNMPAPTRCFGKIFCRYTA